MKPSINAGSQPLLRDVPCGTMNQERYLFLITFRGGDKHLARLSLSDVFGLCFKINPRTIHAITRLP